MKRVWKAAIAAGLSSIPWARASAQLVAFPGAEGFGAAASGGRGGSVYVVTNPNNSGAGSFRDAVSQPDRIVVFAVGGYINLQSAVPVQNDVTILGQTAPGNGIGLMGAELSLSNSSNDIVQYMRVRQGTNSTDTGESSVNAGDATKIMLDHVSVEFGQFDNIDAVGAVNMTIQNSIDADPIGQQFNAHVETGPVTFANNIFSSAHNRSPLIKANTQFVNNVVYNYQAGYTVADTSGSFSQDIVNNYFIAGPGTTNNGGDAFFQMDSTITAYASGNLNDTNLNGKLDGSSVSPGGVTVSSTPTLAGTTSLPTLSAAGAYAFNITHSGDSILHDPTTYAVSSGYDQVDSNVLGDVTSLGTSGQGAGLWTSQTQTGLTNNGYGTLSTTGYIPTSSANDGIPDSWATTHGLSTTNSAGATLQNALGYDMIEQYAQELADALPIQTWSASSGEWNLNSGNWSATAPGPYDHAVISGTGSADGVATVTNIGAMAFSLQIGANGLAAGEKLLVSGGSLTIYNTITVGYQNQGTLQITGGTVVADNVQLGNTVWNSSGNATTYTGTLLLSGGTLQTTEVVQGGGTPGNWTTGSAWTWSGGTLQAGSAGLLVSAPATLGSSGGILDTNGVAAQLNGVLSGAGGFTKIGAGTATLAAANSYLGPTTIDAGTLAATTLANGGTASSLGASSNSAGNLILNGGTLLGTGTTDRLFTLASGSTLDNSDGMSFTNSGAIALASGANLTLTLTGSSTAHNTFSPALGDVGSGFTTSVVVGGTGKWDFSNGVKFYSGDTDVTGGTLETLSQNALSAQSNMVISSGAILDFHAYSQTINALEGAGTVNESFGTAQTLTIGAANGSGTFSGAINGPVSTIKTGIGTEIFSGASTYTGGTAVNAGTLNFTGTLASGAGAITVGNTAATNAILNVASSGIVQGTTLSIGNFATAPGAAYQTAGTLILTQAASSTNFQLGAIASGYGYYNISGGNVAANEFDVGGLFNASTGVMDVTGGAATSNGDITIGRGGTTSSGSLNVTGGTVNFGANTGITGSLDLDWGGISGASAVVNIGGGSGPAAVTGVSSTIATSTTAGSGLNLTASTTAGTQGIVNLLSNGTLTVSDIEASAAATSLLNFNGGTLRQPRAILERRS